MACKLCKERGIPKHFGSPPKCAFKSKTFSGDNWNCATMNALRSICSDGYTQGQTERGKTLVFSLRDDMDCGSIGVIPCHEEGVYLVMTWYKQRGCTSDAILLTDGERRELDEEMALKILKSSYYQSNTENGVKK